MLTISGRTVPPISKQKAIELDKVKKSTIQKTQSIEFSVKERRTELMELVEKEANLLVLELTSLKMGRMKEIEIEKDYIGSQLAFLESYELLSNEFITKGTDCELCTVVDDTRTRAMELQQICESAVDLH